MAKRQNFGELCEKNGIKVFNGIVMDHCQSDIGLFDARDFIEYCKINGIKSAILTYTFAAVEEINIEQIKVKLRRFFDKKCRNTHIQRHSCQSTFHRIFSYLHGWKHWKS